MGHGEARRGGGGGGGGGHSMGRHAAGPPDRATIMANAAKSRQPLPGEPRLNTPERWMMRWADDRVKDMFAVLTEEEQRMVMRAGEITNCRNPTAVLMSRCRDVRKRVGPFKEGFTAVPNASSVTANADRSRSPRGSHPEAPKPISDNTPQVDTRKARPQNLNTPAWMKRQEATGTQDEGQPADEGTKASQDAPKPPPAEQKDEEMPPADEEPAQSDPGKNGTDQKEEDQPETAGDKSPEGDSKKADSDAGDDGDVNLDEDEGSDAEKPADDDDDTNDI
mmetsp:Transcript_56800/g.151578  ORF Transcript_56800/g.151578 Transcript_56800/m.151578 type:complete len:279 (-) Transcript_56800:276-1112(-)